MAARESIKCPVKQSLSDANVNGGVLRSRSTLPSNRRSFTPEQIDVLEQGMFFYVKLNTTKFDVLIF